MTYSNEKDKNVYNAYISGEMSPEDAAQYKSLFESGKISAPVKRLETPFLKRSVFDAYQSGAMTEDERLIVDEAVKKGEYRFPEVRSEKFIEDKSYREETFPEEVPEEMGGGTVYLPERLRTGEMIDADKEPYIAPILDEEFMAPSKELLNTAGRAAKGFLGTAESPTYSAIQEFVPQGRDPLSSLSRGAYSALSKFGDAGILALSALGAAGMGATGFVASQIQKIDSFGRPGGGRGDKSAGRDIMALPEAFSGIGSLAIAPSRLKPYTSPRRVLERTTVDEDRLQKDVIKTQPPPGDIYPRNIKEGMDVNKLQEKLSLASKGGKKSQKAKVDIAKELDIDPKVVDTAERFDINLPVAEMSRNKGFQQTQKEIRKELEDVQEKWDETQEGINKKLSNELSGISKGKSISEISEDIKSSLADSLKKAKELEASSRNKLEKDLNPSTEISPVSTINYIDKKIKLLRGKENLPEELRSLYKRALKGKVYDDVKNGKVSLSDANKAGILIKDGKPLIKESDAFSVENIMSNYIKPMNQKKFSTDNPWQKFSDKERNDLIQVLDQDMMKAAVEKGKWTPDQYTQMKKYTVEKKSYQDSISNLFDKDLEGDMASNIKSIITSGKRGSIEELNDTLNLIPENFRAPVIASSIREASTTKQSGIKSFNPSEFVNTMNLIKDQPPIYNKIKKEIGSNSTQLLEDVYTISNVLHQSKLRSKKGGGISKSEIKDNLAFDNFLTRILDSSITQSILGGVGATAGASTFGALGATALGGIGIFGTKEIAQRLKSGGYSTAVSRGFRKTHDLLSSPEFKKLAVDIGKGVDPVAASKKLAKSSKFRQYYNSLSDKVKRQGVEFGKKVGLDKDSRFIEVYKDGGINSSAALQLWILSQVYESRKEANMSAKEENRNGR